jgi:hypothetical protein
MAAGAELLTRQFTSEITKLLFANNDWLSRSKSDDAFVNNNAVELPHSGGISEALVDPTSFPLTIEKRTDVATNYIMSVIANKPVHLEIDENLTVAYDKRASILEQQAKEIMKTVGETALYNWAAGAANYIPTTGTTRTANTAAGQTGNRKGIDIADINDINTRFYEDDIVGGTDGVNGIAIITPKQLSDLRNISQFTDAEKYGSSNLASGVAVRAFGFDFYIRSSVVRTNNSDVLKAQGAAAAVTDQDAAIFYSPEFVRRAKSGIQVLFADNTPEYLGGIMNARCRFGAAPARNDNKGVYLMFEDTI